MASVKKNYIYNLIAQLLGIILPVITTPYVTRVLGNENLGIFNYIQSIINYFILFGCIGLNTYGQREIAFHKHDRKRQSETFWELMIIRVVTISTSSLLYWQCIVKGSDYPLCYSIMGIELFAALCDVSWFLQGNENFKSQAIRVIVTRLIGLACIFLFVKTKEDLYLYILCCSGSILIGNLALIPYLKKHLQPVRFKDLHPLHHIGPTLTMFLPQIAVNVYTQLDKTMLGLLTNHNYDAVGFYSQAEKVVKIVMTIVTSLGTIMLSRVSVAVAQEDEKLVKSYVHRSFQFMYFLAWPITIGLSAIALDFVPWFFGPNYEPVIRYIAMLSPLVLIIGSNSIFGTIYLLPTNRMRTYTIAIFIGMSTNVVCNFLLIPKFGVTGAVIGTLLAEFNVLLSEFIALRHEFKASIILHGTKNAIAAIFMGAAVLFLSRYLPPTIWATIVEAAVGAIVYFLLLFLFKDTFFRKEILSIAQREMMQKLQRFSKKKE